MCWRSSGWSSALTCRLGSTRSSRARRRTTTTSCARRAAGRRRSTTTASKLSLRRSSANPAIGSTPFDSSSSGVVRPARRSREMWIASFLPFFSTLAGGYAALRLRHRLHALMAIAAGVVVATAIADLLPEAFELVGDGAPLKVGIAAVTGFIGFSFLEAFIHQSSFEHGGAPGHDHSEDHDHVAVDAA